MLARRGGRDYRLGRDMGASTHTLAMRRLGPIMLALAAASCAGEAPQQDPTGGVPSIVSLNPCLDAILVEVAGPEQIRALSHYSLDESSSSIDPGIAREFGTTGGTAEEVIALDPDLVLASNFIAPATLSALERAGLRVETFGSPTSTAESLEQVREVARLAGKPGAGEELADAILASPTQPKGGGHSALLWQPGQIVAGEASLVAEHLEWAGFTNHATARGMQQADHITLEQILSDPPQVLLIAGDLPGQSHPLLDGNLKSMHVARFDPGLFYCAGPSIPQARARLLEIREEVVARP